MDAARSVGNSALFVMALFVLGSCTASTLDSSSTTVPSAEVSVAPDGGVGSTQPPQPDPSRLLAAYLNDPGSVDLDDVVASLLPTVRDRTDLSGALHGAVRFESRPPGRQEVAIPIGFNQQRRVIVRTPEGYDPARAWPLLVVKPAHQVGPNQTSETAQSGAKSDKHTH